MIKRPDFVRNINYMGSQGNQPTNFYATTASGVPVIDALGINSQGGFPQYYQAIDSGFYVTGTNFAIISGTQQTITLQRAAIVDVGYGGLFTNTGLPSVGANTTVSLFIDGNEVINSACPGSYNTAVTQAVADTFYEAVLISMTAGTHTFDVRFKSTSSTGFAYMVGTLAKVKILVLGQ